MTKTHSEIPLEERFADLKKPKACIANFDHYAAKLERLNKRFPWVGEYNAELVDLEKIFSSYKEYEAKEGILVNLDHHTPRVVRVAERSSEWEEYNAERAKLIECLLRDECKSRSDEAK